VSAQLQRKLIRAPFKGRLGIRAVSVGQYLNPGMAVTTLDALGATFVDFALPQEELASVRVGLPVRVTSEGAKRAVEGTISAIDPAIDPVTRNLRIRASLPAEQAPRPGAFVNVEVVKPGRASLVVVPATAVVHAPYGDSVFVIEPKPPGSPGMATAPDGRPVKRARQQFVRLGRTHGDFVAVVKGLGAGQQVVTAGAFKLRNGSPVVVDDKLDQRPKLDPRPENR
jgi:membrane fusion protein (multidrug efflux system)